MKGVSIDIKFIEEMIKTSGNEVLKEKLQDVLKEAESEIENYTVEGIENLVMKLQDDIDMNANIGKVDSIHSGKVWVDTDGVPIQAHGSNIMYDENTKMYYWYGEHKGADNISTGEETGTPAIGISCYSSKDLYNWINEGVVLPVFNNPQLMDGVGNRDTAMYLSEKSETYKNSLMPEFSGSALSDMYEKSPVDSLSKFDTDEYIEKLNEQYEGLSLEEKQNMYREFNWNRVVERPKVVYNEKTDKYVMWWHQDGPTVGKYTVASAGIAISDSPTGPFKYLGTTRMPETGYYPNGNGEGMLRDMTVFVDDDSTGYVIFASEENATIIIQKLNKEYTGPSGDIEGVDYVRIFQGQYREAPAMFKDGETYYLITSGQSGWNPNPCKYSVSQNGIFGDWSAPEFFCVDDIDLNGNLASLQKDGTTFRSQSTNVLSYRDENGNKVDGKFIYMGDRWLRENLKDSRYIWLPIELDSETGTLTMKWRDVWNFEEEFFDSGEVKKGCKSVN